MVQIIEENRKPTAAENLGKGLSGLYGAASQFMQQRQRAAALKGENEALAKQGINLAGINDPKLRQQLAVEHARQLGKTNRNEQAKSFLNEIINKNAPEQGQRRSLSDITAEQALQAENMGLKGVTAARESALKADKEHEERIREKNSVKELLKETGDYDEEQIEQLSEYYDVATAKALNLKKKEPSPYEPTAQKLAAERTNKYIDSVEAKGRSADEKLRGLNEAWQLHKQGATGFKATNWLADYFGIPALADPGSKAFNASMKSQYSGIGDIVKGKVSNFEFQTFQQRIATAEDSPQAAEALMLSAMMESKIAQKEADLVRQKRQEYYEQGKSEPANFDLQIQQELRPYADLILAQTNNDLKNLLNPTKKDNPNKQILDNIWGQ